MSRVMHLYPREGQSEADFWIDQIHKLRKGKGEEKGWAEVAIIMKLLEEIKDPEPPGETQPHSLSVKVYNLLESVHKDLEVYDYGQAPFNEHVFPVADSLTVVGDLYGSRTGFSLDFYSKKVKPTQTLAFMVGASPKVLRRAAASVFKFQNAHGTDAYTAREIEKRVVDLGRLGLEGTVDGLAVEGQLAFGGTKGKKQREVMRRMVQNYEHLEGFTPDKFVIKSYNFGFEPHVGKPGWREGLKYLFDRIDAVFEEKAKKAA